MGQFSDDGQWWWDGTTWVATAEVVLPQLPTTEFEQSGKLKKARDRRRSIQWLYLPNSFAATLEPFSPLAWLTGVPMIVLGWGAMRDYRSWTLEQLALATAYLLGPDEPMVAGEGTFIGEPWTPDFAIAVTAAHVLVFRIDSVGQPRWIVLAGRATDVKIGKRTGPFGFGSALIVGGGTGQWIIRGQPGAFKPKPVLDAWWHAANATPKTG
jgi:hypothetical protein